MPRYLAIPEGPVGASPYEPEGREFESPRAHHSFQEVTSIPDFGDLRNVRELSMFSRNVMPSISAQGFEKSRRHTVAGGLAWALASKLLKATSLFPPEICRM
jgi:hypothetical protein